MSAAAAPLPRRPRRADDCHKGSFGLALVVGGSRGMIGAMGLAGMAALRGGAGLVRLAVPNCCLDVAATFDPSYMTVPLPDDAVGRIGPLAYEQIVEAAQAATVVAVGPGMGRSWDLDQLVGRLYRELEKPMVVDADGLNALSADPDQLGEHAAPRILTPHPGEFARLVGRKLDADQREPVALELAERCRIVIALKSHRTLVTDGLRRHLNATGNPGMAVGGTGDVLTGLIAALWCQGIDAFEAAQLGVHLHGLAGDLAAEDIGQVSMTAGDLIRYLPGAFKQHHAGV